MWSFFPPSEPLLFLPTRSAMSALASVVSLGSPGSATARPLASEPARCLLGGWGSGAVVSPSEAEASREDGCGAGSMRSVELRLAAGRFRLLAEAAEGVGEDMVADDGC